MKDPNRLRFTKREHIFFNLYGLAVGVLYWPFHLIGLAALIGLAVLPILPIGVKKYLGD